MIERPASFIVTARIADLERPHAPADPALCSVCGAGVWLGRSVLRDVPDGVPICWPCARSQTTQDDVIVVTPEVRREAAAILARMGRHDN